MKKGKVGKNRKGLLFLFLAFGGFFLAGFRAFGTVFGAAAAAAIHSEAVECAADNVIADTGQIFDTTATNENDRVFLKVVTFSGDVSDDFLAVGQTDFGHFAESGVGLLGGAGHNLHADTATLGTHVQSRGFGLHDDLLAAFADELIDGRHGKFKKGDGVGKWERSNGTGGTVLAYALCGVCF